MNTHKIFHSLFYLTMISIFALNLLDIISVDTVGIALVFMALIFEGVSYQFGENING